MSGLPELIPPQPAVFGKADADGNVTINIHWYLFLYNLASQVFSLSNGSITVGQIDLLLIDGDDNVEPVEGQSADAISDPLGIDISGADNAKSLSALQAIRALVADLTDYVPVAGNAGNVVGPASATSGNVALFDGATGKLIKDGGTLGTAAFTASTAYDVSGAAAAVTPTTLGLVIGTNTQAHGVKLDSIQALASAAGLLYNNGAGAFSYQTYTEYTAASAACTGAILTSCVWKATKVGNMVTLTLPVITGTCTAVSYILLGIVLPVAFRPIVGLKFVTAIKDNGAVLTTPGGIFVDTDGSIYVSANIPGTANYTNGANGGLPYATGLSWTV